MLRPLLLIANVLLSHLMYAGCKGDSILIEGGRHICNLDKANLSRKYKLKINVGAFHAYSKASFLVQKGDKGTLIDPREDLNFEDSKIIPKAELSYEPSERHEISFLFWVAKRKADNRLEKDIYFNNVLFPIGTELESKLTITNYSLTYRYSIFKREHWKAGASVGTKLINFKTRLNTNFFSSSNTTLALGPMAGIHGTFFVGKSLSFKGTIEYFKITLNEWHYKSTDLKGGVEFYPFRNIGIGADYHYMNISFRRSNEDSKRNFDYKFHAFSLYLSFRI